MPAFTLIKRVIAGLLFLTAATLLVHLIGDLQRVKALETDLAELNHVRYGLLDADQWVARISAILERRINEFELTDANRPQIKEAVERVLNALLIEIERYLRQRNLSGGGTWMDQLQGVLRQGVQDLLIDFDRLRKRVPEYADAVVEQLSRPQAKQEIKTQLLILLRQAADATFAKTDRSGYASLLARHDCLDGAACTQKLEAAIATAQPTIHAQLGGILTLVALLFLLCLIRWPGRSRRPDPANPLAESPDRIPLLPTGGEAATRLDPFALTLLTGATLVLLAGGVLTPMIEIDARIHELSLQLLGEPVVFTNQVLYFQTKSIVEVMRILAETGKPDMMLVALLLTLFSLIFPSLKLIATYLYYYDQWAGRTSPWIRFFALRSSKWSMADVMVIAMFMAYIGFDGLVANQLGSLARPGSGVDLLTTNGTALEPGFYLFLGFVLASLVLSTALENEKTPPE